jgi:hypothetical protein
MSQITVTMCHEAELESQTLVTAFYYLVAVLFVQLTIQPSSTRRSKFSLNLQAPSNEQRPGPGTRSISMVKPTQPTKRCTRNIC